MELGSWASDAGWAGMVSESIEIAERAKILASWILR